MIDYPKFSDLLGKTLTRIVGGQVGDEEIQFLTDTGEVYKLYHCQDCCESVRLEDVCGELSDLIGSPIVQAEENSEREGEPKPQYSDRWTWTFYRIATAKGQVVLRWLGESNGYYSESVDFAKL